MRWNERLESMKLGGGAAPQVEEQRIKDAMERKMHDFRGSRHGRKDRWNDDGEEEQGEHEFQPLTGRWSSVVCPKVVLCPRKVRDAS